MWLPLDGTSLAPPSGSPPIGGGVRSSSLRVLFITPYVPSRIRVRPYHLLRGLAQRGHRITLLCPHDGADDQPDLAELRPVCEQIVTIPQRRAERMLASVKGMSSGLPLQAVYNCTPQLLELVRQTAANMPFDIVHAEHLRGARLGLVARSAGLPLVYDAVDCISLLFERALRGSPALKTRCMALLDLARTRRYEAAYQQHFDQILVTSPEDSWALETLRQQYGLPADGAITVLPNGVDLDYFVPQSVERHPATVVFSGKMSYHANHAAAMFLLGEIMPLVWQVRPDVRVQIVGAHPAPSLAAFAADSRIDVTGYVHDLRPYLARATLAVCPLRYGVGIQNKVLEAMAMATPVIVARQATVALEAQPSRDLLVAEQPADYANQLVDLLHSAPRRQTLGQHGRRYVERQHTWARSIARLESVYEQAFQPSR